LKPVHLELSTSLFLFKILLVIIIVALFGVLLAELDDLLVVNFGDRWLEGLASTLTRRFDWSL